MQKDKNWQNVALKVIKILPNHSGKTYPAPIPAKMAIIIRGKSPILLNGILKLILLTKINGLFFANVVKIFLNCASLYISSNIFYNFVHNKTLKQLYETFL